MSYSRMITIEILLQVLIFSEKKQDVDAIHEYLLLKGVEAVAIHGGKGKHYALIIICLTLCLQLLLGVINSITFLYP